MAARSGIEPDLEGPKPSALPLRQRAVTISPKFTSITSQLREDTPRSWIQPAVEGTVEVKNADFDELPVI